MKSLSKLDISNNDIGDAGVNEIIKGIKNYSQLEYLDISGNNLGKSPVGIELAENMN